MTKLMISALNKNDSTVPAKIQPEKGPKDDIKTLALKAIETSFALSTAASERPYQVTWSLAFAGAVGLGAAGFVMPVLLIPALALLLVGLVVQLIGMVVKNKETENQARLNAILGMIPNEQKELFREQVNKLFEEFRDTLPSFSSEKLPSFLSAQQTKQIFDKIFPSR